MRSQVSTLIFFGTITLLLATSAANPQSAPESPAKAAIPTVLPASAVRADTIGRPIPDGLLLLGPDKTSNIFVSLPHGLYWQRGAEPDAPRIKIAKPHYLLGGHADENGGLHLFMTRDPFGGKLVYANNRTGVWSFESPPDASLRGLFVKAVRGGAMHFFSYSASDSNKLVDVTNVSGAWEVQTVMDGFQYKSGEQGWGSYRVVLGNRGALHAAVVNYRFVDPEFRMQLRYATNATGEYQVEIVDEDGFIDGWPVVGLNNDGSAHIFYVKYEGGIPRPTEQRSVASLHFAVRRPEGWVKTEIGKANEISLESFAAVVEEDGLIRFVAGKPPNVYEGAVDPAGRTTASQPLAPSAICPGVYGFSRDGELTVKNVVSLKDGERKISYSVYRNNLCDVISETVVPGTLNRPAQRDDEGNILLLYNTVDDRRLVFRRVSKKETRDSTIEPGGTNAPDLIDVALDDNGRVTLLVREPKADELTRMTLDNSDRISELLSIPKADPRVPVIVKMGSGGGIHGVAANENKISYVSKNGDIAAVEVIDDNGRYTDPTMTIGAEGTVHVVYTEAGYLRYAAKRHAEWDKLLVNHSGNVYGPLFLMEDRKGRVHIVYLCRQAHSRDADVMYSVIDDREIRTSVVARDGALSSKRLRIAVGRQGDAFVFYYATDDPERGNLIPKFKYGSFQGKTWREIPIKDVPWPGTPLDAQLDSRGRMHFIIDAGRLMYGIRDGHRWNFFDLSESDPPLFSVTRNKDSWSYYQADENAVWDLGALWLIDAHNNPHFFFSSYISYFTVSTLWHVTVDTDGSLDN
ncbi:MAG: hypothetical protein M5R36_12285 [Deltaproteobacteria bacterium]|nr:hypothetical protein [Deltaproteobacteria bacterium]